MNCYFETVMSCAFALTHTPTSQRCIRSVVEGQAKVKIRKLWLISMLNKKTVFIITSYMSSKRNIMKIRPIWKQYIPEILQFEQDGWIYFGRNPEWNAISASILACASKVYDWKPESA
jgi:hypothetical protein